MDHGTVGGNLVAQTNGIEIGEVAEKTLNLFTKAII